MDIKGKAIPAITTIISLCSLTMSTIGIIYAIKTYNISNRPYIGIEIVNRETHMDSPNKIKWTAIIKNAGKVPGVVLREQFKAYITDGNDRETTKLIQQDVNGAKYLLPDNTFKYTGQFVTVDGIASVKDVINDKTRLYIEIKLYYSLPGYSDPQYFYEAKLRATPNIGVEQGFMFVSAIENSLSSH